MSDINLTLSAKVAQLNFVNSVFILVLIKAWITNDLNFE